MQATTIANNQRNMGLLPKVEWPVIPASELLPITLARRRVAVLLQHFPRSLLRQGRCCSDFSGAITNRAGNHHPTVADLTGAATVRADAGLWLRWLGSRRRAGVQRQNTGRQAGEPAGRGWGGRQCEQQQQDDRSHRSTQTPVEAAAISSASTPSPRPRQRIRGSARPTIATKRSQVELQGSCR